MDSFFFVDFEFCIVTGKTLHALKYFFVKNISINAVKLTDAIISNVYEYPIAYFSITGIINSVSK